MKILKHPGQITLFSRPMCGWCQEAKAWIEQRGWKYLGVDVGVDLTARQRAIDLSGQSLVPVILVDDHVLGDFDTDQLETFLRQHGYLE